MEGTVDQHPKWNYNEFLAFLLRYASDADMEFSTAEKELILTKIDTEHLKCVQEEFDKNNDFERINIISSYRERFYNDPEKKAELLVRIEEIFEVDGEYSQTEHNLFMMLRKLL